MDLKDIHIDSTWDFTPRPLKSEEDITLDIIRGGLEAKFGIKFKKFIKAYNSMLKDNPEKLI